MQKIKPEYEKMLSGELYNASDPVLVNMRINARNYMYSYNHTNLTKEDRYQLLKKILGKMGSGIDIEAPFYFDYGCHIEVGNNFFANFNCVLLDCNYIRVGNNVFLGPNVQIYTAYHPLIAEERIKGPECAREVNIGDNVWIGGGAIICPGITIGANTTIGAGSVVVKDIPGNVVAAGNPCRVVRNL